ncbi:MAG: hypothetical protein KGI69_00880 [Patescibacteria group bacterium]|nr:hypothetical protein [Patescibacteria group bacterium]
MIKWNEVTWYSMVLAVVLAVATLCLGTYIGISYKETYPGSAGISYLPDFPAFLSKVPISGWKTYTSASGYEILYPADMWTYIVCAGGAQTEFYDSSGYVPSCDEPHTIAELTISGPSNVTEPSGGSRARLAEGFTLDGLPAVRYSDLPTGQSGDDLVTMVEVSKGGRRFDISFDTMTGEKAMTTFHFISSTASGAGQPSSSSPDISAWRLFEGPQQNGFRMRMPPGWVQAVAAPAGGPWYFMSTSSPLVHGIGLPATGSWIEIARGICNDHATSFVEKHSPDVFEETLCRNGFQIALGVWANDPQRLADEQLLEDIAATFQPL